MDTEIRSLLHLDNEDTLNTETLRHSEHWMAWAAIACISRTLSKTTSCYEVSLTQNLMAMCIGAKKSRVK